MMHFHFAKCQHVSGCIVAVGSIYLKCTSSARTARECSSCVRLPFIQKKGTRVMAHTCMKRLAVLCAHATDAACLL